MLHFLLVVIVFLSSARRKLINHGRAESWSLPRSHDDGSRSVSVREGCVLKQGDESLDGINAVPTGLKEFTELRGTCKL